MKTSCRDNSRSISWVRWASGNIFYVFDVKKTKHCQISSHMLSLIENHFKTLLPFFYLRHLIYRLSFLSFIFYLHHNLCFHGCFPNNSSKWQTLFGNIKPLRFCNFFVFFYFVIVAVSISVHSYFGWYWQLNLRRAGLSCLWQSVISSVLQCISDTVILFFSLLLLLLFCYFVVLFPQ